MHRNRNLFLSLTFLSTIAFGCDDGESTDATAARERGVGGLAPLLLADADAAAAKPQPVQTTTLDVAAQPQEQRCAAIGLPPRDKDMIGWVRWSGALPYYAGPIFDQTGEQCGEGQSGSTWYLAGTAGGPVERECTIPVGKRLVFPLLNYYGAVPESYYSTPEAVDAYLADFASTGEFFRDITCSLEVTLDGVPLYDDLADDTWLEVLEPFEVTLPDSPDNFADWYGLVGGTTPAVGVGYYARTAPLSPGDHTLSFGGSLCFEGEVWFETHATYQIHVE